MRKKQTRRFPHKTVTIRSVIQKLIALCANMPAGIFAVAVILTLCSGLHSLLWSATPPISYVILVLGMGLTFWFNRSRVFFILLMLIASQWMLLYYRDHNEAKFNIAFALITTLLPLNILFFASREERGVVSAFGKQSSVLLAGQAAFIGSMLLPGEDPLFALLTHPFLPIALPTPIPHLALLFYIFTAFILLARRNFSGRHAATPFFGTLMAIVMGHHLIAQPIALPLFYTAAATMLCLSVIQASHSMAYLDDLTGLPSRRALNEDLLKLSGTYVIAMLDIDHFKNFNDTYGHDAGDDVLRFIGTMLKGVSGGGKIYRYGGEEFTVLFPGKTIKESLTHLETLRCSVAEREFVLRSDGKKPGKKTSITVSIGVAEPRRRYMKPDDVLKEADTALYRAKEKGRNCVST